MSFHTHLLDSSLSDQLELIRPLLDDGITITAGSEIPPETEFLVTEYCPEELLDRLGSLKLVMLPCAGVPAAMRAVLTARPNIAAHNLHYNDISVAETAIGLLLATRKRLIPLDRSLREGYWTPPTVDTRHALLSGSRCLLLGFGAVGRRIAPVLDSLGIEVRVVKRTCGEGLPYPCFTPDDWKECLPSTDILISTLPSTVETHEMIDGEVLEALPDHAVFVNVGRGDTVDEGALFQALQDRKIGGAGFDVWWNYPDTFPYGSDDVASPCWPSEWPYHTLENVVLSPHRGSDHRMEGLQKNFRRMLAERMRQASEGEVLPDRVDPLRGY